MPLRGFLRRDNGHAAIARALLAEVHSNITLINQGQALHVGTWQAIVATKKTPALGDAAYAAQRAYEAATAFNTALVAYHQNFIARGSDRPAPVLGEREACEAFLADQRTSLLETFGGLARDLQARVGS